MTMYKNFIFESQGQKLTGYEWELNSQQEIPKAVVCLIHGIGEHAGRYENVAKTFNDSGIVLIGMDLRGHGRSPGKRGHIDERSIVREDVDNLITYAKNKYPQSPIIIYGHSLGGNIALDYRLRGKLSDQAIAYLITSPWVKLVRPIPDALLTVVGGLSKIMPQATIGQSIENKMLGNLELIEQEEDSDLRHQKISFLTATEGFGIAKELVSGSIKDEYGGGKKPMLLMHGDNDPICDVEGSRAIAKLYDEICQYEEWEDYLHELHNGTNDKSHIPPIKRMADWILTVSQ